MPKKILKIIGRVLLYGFAAVGLFLTVGWTAINLGLTNGPGAVDKNDRYFAETAAARSAAASQVADPNRLATNLCRARTLKKYWPETGAKILTVYDRTQSATVLDQMLTATELYAKDNSAYQAESQKCADQKFAAASLLSSAGGETNLYAWIDTPEWQTLKQALAKDKEVIAHVGAETGVPPRLIVAMIVGEQLRLFHDNREVFKQFFQPLKILGNEVQFSLGVAGIKEDTAKQIERNLTDRTSLFYLGLEAEHRLDFKTGDKNQERFARLTAEKDHTYSYLYTALFLKQVEAQWQKAGFPLAGRPEVLATIFNLGFEKSVPKSNPQVGGSEISLAGRTYTFGALAYEFYYSGEMGDEFPF